MSFENLVKDVTDTVSINDSIIKERLASITEGQFLKSLPDITKHLNDKHKERTITILKMKYGLGYDKEHTVRDIAKHFFISTDRVRESLTRITDTIKHYYSLEKLSKVLTK